MVACSMLCTDGLLLHLVGKRHLLVYSRASYGNGKLGYSIWESHHKSSVQGNTPHRSHRCKHLAVLAMVLTYEHTPRQYSTKVASGVGTFQEDEAMTLLLRTHQLAPQKGMYEVVPDSKSAVGTPRGQTLHWRRHTPLVCAHPTSGTPSVEG